MASKVLVEGGKDRVQPLAWRSVAYTGDTPEAGAAAAVAEDRSVGTYISDREPPFDVRIRQAREAGFREGEAAARDRAEEQVRSATARVAESIAAIEEYRSRLLRQTEVGAVRLAVAIARRVLRRELTVDPAAIEGLVSAALHRLQSQENCQVRIHPDHVAVLRASIERLGMSAKVEIIPDPAREPGAAVFEMARGNLDASIDMQLKEIERGLVDRFQRPW